MHWLTLVVLVACTGLLIFFGGGLFTDTLCSVAALACATCALLRLRGSAAGVPCRSWFARFGFEFVALLIILYVGLTVLPLPPRVSGWWGAERAFQNAVVRDALADGARLGLVSGPEPWFSLTRNRAGTLRWLVLWLLLFAGIGLAAGLTVSTRLVLLRVLMLMAVAVAVAGHLSRWYWPQGDRLWWLFPIPHVLPGPIGGFVNRNHFGGFVALFCPAALALAAADLRQRRWALGLLNIACFGVMLTVLLFSLSRGAFVACTTALVATAGLLLIRRQWVAGLLVALCLLAAAVAIPHLKHPAVRERLRTLRTPREAPSVQSRLSAWRETARVWSHYPVVGAGANALRYVYPQYRRTSSGGWLVHAENEYVQLPAEGGIVGLLLCVALFTAALGRYRAWTAPPPHALFVGVLGALVVAAVHAAFDFPLRLPAYAFVVAILGGLLLPTVAPATSAPWRVRLLGASPAIVGLVVLAVIAPTHHVDMGDLDSPYALSQAPLPRLRRALIWAPTSFHAWHALGRTAWLEGRARGRRPWMLFGEQCMTQAAQWDPRNYRLWHQLGFIRRELGDLAAARAAFDRARALRSWLYIPPLERGP